MPDRRFFLTHNIIVVLIKEVTSVDVLRFIYNKEKRLSSVLKWLEGRFHIVCSNSSLYLAWKLHEKSFSIILNGSKEYTY